MNGSLNLQEQQNTEIATENPHYQLMCNNSPIESKENFQFNLIFIAIIIILEYFKEPFL